MAWTLHEDPYLATLTWGEVPDPDTWSAIVAQSVPGGWYPFRLTRDEEEPARNAADRAGVAIQANPVFLTSSAHVPSRVAVEDLRAWVVALLAEPDPYAEHFPGSAMTPGERLASAIMETIGIEWV